MPIIYSATTDNDISTGVSATWSSVRDASTGTLGDASGTSDSFAVSVFRFTGRGADTYRAHRSFFHFDTSGITATVSEATLKLFSTSVAGDANIIVLASDAFTGGSDALVADDFNNLDFSTPYSGEVDTSGTSGSGTTFDITLNAAALAIMTSSNDFKIAVVNYDYDYNNTAPPSGNNHRWSLYYADQIGTTYDPRIDYTLATGYGHGVNGVAAANIGKVDGVTTANISKVIGV